VYVLCVASDGLLKRKVKKLTQLRLKEISGVDHPASLTEGWMVAKADDDALEVAVLDAIDEIETDDLEKNVEIETQPDTEVSEPEVEATEDVTILSKERAELRKELADARAEVQALTETAEIQKAVRDAQRWAIVPQLEPEEFAPVLRSIRKQDNETAQAVEAILDAVAIALGEAGILKEIGSDSKGEEAGDSYAIIEAKAQALVADGSETSLAKAIGTVAEQNPELYSQYVAEQRGA
jgi:hypothetical protein